MKMNFFGAASDPGSGIGAADHSTKIMRLAAARDV